ncbi:MAG: hypothetical protein R3F34_05780 [Planctomycetota bacterium]
MSTDPHFSDLLRCRFVTDDGVMLNYGPDNLWVPTVLADRLRG